MSDYVYERMLLLAQARGLGLTEYCRERLGIAILESQQTDEFKQQVEYAEKRKLEQDRDEALRKHGWNYYVTKRWKNRKERRVWVRPFPYPEFDAIRLGEPDKAGQYLLRIQEVKAGQVLKDERVFYRSLRQYKRAVNREVGWPVYKVRGRSSVQGAAP